MNPSQLEQMRERIAYLCEAYAEARKRISELEEKLRWRDCKFELPEIGINVLRRRSQVTYYHTYIQALWDGTQWVASLGGPIPTPNQWRPIE